MTRRGPNETTDAMHARLSTESFAPFPVEVLDLAGDAERWAAGLYAPQVSASERAEVVAAIAAAIVKGQPLSAAPAGSGEAARQCETELRFTYRNWRGEVAERRVLASSVRFSWGSTEWHPEPQMLMTAVDLDKHAMRAFAWNDIVRPAALGRLAAALADLKALVDLVTGECTSVETQSDPDDDTVGWSGDGKPLPMTFGHIRRANRAIGFLEVLSASDRLTGDDRRHGPLSEILVSWTVEEQTAAASCLAHPLGMVLRPATAPDAPLPTDVVALVIAARNVAVGDAGDALISNNFGPERRTLDKASEAFASRVPWDDEPEAEKVEDPKPNRNGITAATRIVPGYPEDRV